MYAHEKIAGHICIHRGNGVHSGPIFCQILHGTHKTKFRIFRGLIQSFEVMVDSRLCIDECRLELRQENGAPLKLIEVANVAHG